VVIANNAYVDSTETWSHIVTDEASMYRQMGGKHTFLVAPSGTADANLALSTALEITNDGNVTTPNRFTMSGTGSGPGLFMGGWQIFDNASESYGPANSLAFYKGGSRFAVSPSGGITFNGDTAAANTLNDYEEGTWTPTIVGESSAGTYTYLARSGTYTKVGDLVTVMGYFANITGSPVGSGVAHISGLPYAARGFSNAYGPVGAVTATYCTISGTLVVWPYSSLLYIIDVSSGADRTHWPVTSLSSGSSDMGFTVTYHTDL
jgi:hypothetical protein